MKTFKVTVTKAGTTEARTVTVVAKDEERARTQAMMQDAVREIKFNGVEARFKVEEI
jgi:hypothetical protein